jgi:hypothetical protein
MHILLRATAIGAVAATSLAAQAASDSAARRLQRSVDSLIAVVRAIEARQDNAPPSQPAQAPRAAGAYMNIGFSGLSDFGWSSDPNVAKLQQGDHDPHVRGFTIPNAELALDGNVDPYFKGFTNIVYKLDEKGETSVELEEMFAITTALPGNLQLKAGQFFTEFGRQNNQHPHAWMFIDQPLVMNRMFGPEGLRSQGARLSWLLPTSFYTEAMVGVLNSAGGATFSFRSDESGEIHGGVPIDRGVSGLGDLLVVPRIATSFDPTETQTVLMGVSGAFGPNNSGPNARTAIYGADLYWKWKSATAFQGFPFVSWQTEAMLRHYDAAARQAPEPGVTLRAESLRDQGVYSQLLWGIKPRIVAGLRGDLVSGNPAAFDTEAREDRYRVSPNFTWYPTEFSKLRLQYNFDHRKLIGNDHSLWLQFEFIMGAHAAHKF